MRRRFVTIFAAILLLGATMGPANVSPAGVSADVVAEIVKTYQEAAARLKAIVLKPPGGTEKSQAYTQARAAQQLAQIQQIKVELGQRASQWTGKAITAAMSKGIALANSQAKEAGVSPSTGSSGTVGSFALIDPGIVKQFAADTYADLAKAAGSMADVAASTLRHTRQMKLSEVDINRILAGGSIEGKPVETIRRLREALRAVHGDLVEITDKNGDPLHFSVGYYASVVARTKTRQASVAARHERLSGLGLDLVSIVGRISKNFCTAYLGKVFSISGKSDKYPALDELPSDGPPFHPNCSKSTAPFIESLASPAEIDEAEGTDDQDQFVGVTDTSKLQRMFKDLQMHQQITAAYGTTAGKIYGGQK
jgi:hypothetical protein